MEGSGHAISQSREVGFSQKEGDMIQKLPVNNYQKGCVVEMI